MYYVDTSILAAYYCSEALSTKAETFLTSDSETSISHHLTEVELYSALPRKIHEGNLNRDDAACICDLFVSHRDASFYRRLEAASHHYMVMGIAHQFHVFTGLADNGVIDNPAFLQLFDIR